MKIYFYIFQKALEIAVDGEYKVTMKTRKQHPRVKAKAQRIAKAKRMQELAKYHTYDEIGNAENPPISRQRVGQLIASLK